MADNEPLLFRTVLGSLRPAVSANILDKATRRFEASFERRADDQCWYWLGRTRPAGYGVFNVGTGSPIQATQIMLRAYAGEPPFPGAFALHSCDDPLCVNPHHLRWGTARDNSDDREARGRSVKPRGERHGQAKLTEENVRFIRKCGLSLREMQEIFGVSIRVLSLARAGKTWRHVT